jgi:hypothetical protein
MEMTISLVFTAIGVQQQLPANVFDDQSPVQLA